MNKLGVDGHAIAGAGGLIASVAMFPFNAWLSGLAAAATGAYMILRACREYVKLRQDIKKLNQDTKNELSEN